MTTTEGKNGLKQQTNEEELLNLKEMEGVEGGGDCRIACRIACEKGCLLAKLAGDDAIKVLDPNV